MVDTLGAPPAGAVRLRGLIRVGDHARIAVTTDPDQRTGYAFEFPLDHADAGFDIASCIDWLRTVTARDLISYADGSERDSHGNRIVAAVDVGWSAQLRATRPDQNYFTLLSLLLFGGGPLWFEDTYALAGYLLTGRGRHRLYLHDQAAGKVLGIDLPLTAADRQVTPGFGGQLPQELASIIRSGQIRVQPQLKPDEYCTVVYDLTAWLDPSAA